MKSDFQLFLASRSWVKCFALPLVILGIAIGGQRPLFAQLSSAVALCCAALVLCLTMTYINFGDDGYQELIASISDSTKRLHQNRIVQLCGCTVVVAVGTTVLTLPLARDMSSLSFASVAFGVARAAGLGFIALAVGLIGDRHIISHEAARLLVVAATAVALLIAITNVGWMADSGSQQLPSVVAMLTLSLVLLGASAVLTSAVALRNAR